MIVLKFVLWYLDKSEVSVVCGVCWTLTADGTNATHIGDRKGRNIRLAAAVISREGAVIVSWLPSKPSSPSIGLRLKVVPCFQT